MDDEEYDSDEEFDEGDLEELDEEELDEELEEDVDLEADLDEEDVDDAVLEEEETVLLEEEEPDSDEVEATLDQILQARLDVRAGADEDEDEDEDDEAAPGDDRGTATGVAPKRPGEFTCRSCFLVKHPSQLADARRMLCRDCV